METGSDTPILNVLLKCRLVAWGKSESLAKSALRSAREALLNIMRKPKPTHLANLFPKLITLHHKMFHFNLSHL